MRLSSHLPRAACLLSIVALISGCQGMGVAVLPSASTHSVASSATAMRGATQAAKPGPDEISEDMDYEAAKRMAERAVQRNACIQQSRAMPGADATSPVTGYAPTSGNAAIVSNANASGTVQALGKDATAASVDPC